MSSKTDSPPSYEDALQHPKTVNYPFQTQHGTPLTPPPSYSPSPSACIGPPSYWSQGGVYPQAGMCPGPGFSQPIVPIPTLSAGLPASSPGEMDDFISNQWETTSIRHAFIRK
ncbi:PREDICTED: extensin-like, partial [Cyprinodon variegatus]|uniref:extensin-like n=1 Tax=Cyprinodon variegatus TaxID=28743 RepID=UPI000742CBA7